MFGAFRGAKMDKWQMRIIVLAILVSTGKTIPEAWEVYLKLRDFAYSQK